MAEKQKPTTADYVVTAVSPALITALIGSLVFFLAEILYAGEYEGRLLYTLFFLIGGMVLVARISIAVDQTRAKIYGLLLMGVSWAALRMFVQYPKESGMAELAGLINLFLMVVIWWCANKLTWDCTFIDNKRKASGKGLLAATGIEQQPEAAIEAIEEDVVVEDVDSEAEAQRSLFERWSRFRKLRKKRPHTPGVTVIWFSLAALPIFGLGQSLIPPQDEWRRFYTFWLASVYVGSALGLLLTTSFLGLRRYLRQRNLPMPNAMTGIWLGFGALLVFIFLAVGALLPRPFSETPIWGLKRLSSVERQASKNARLTNSAGKGEGAAGEKTKAGDGPAASGKGEPGDKNDGGKKGDGGKDASDKQGGGDKKDGNDGGEKSDDAKNGKDDKTGDAKKQESSSNSSSRAGKEEGEKSSSSSSDSGRRFPDTRLGNLMEKAAGFFKWAVFIALALLVVVFLIRATLKYFSNFSPWAKDLLAAWSAWWHSLFAKKKRSAPAIAGPAKLVRRPFTSYTNPFSGGGDADDRSTEELIEYSFIALEAWAADRNHPRQPDETPLEFASRLTSTFRSLEGQPHKLAILVALLAYATGKLPEDARTTVEFFWDHLATTMIDSEAA